jgi:hypothetical protein
MNKPTVKSSNTSEHPKYRDFTVKRMNKLLNIYNKTVHTTTKHTPEEMKADPELEVRYIIDKIYQVERRKKLKDFELKPGTWVRYILERIPGQKRRYKVSPEAYQISHKQGNAYVLIAADGSTKTVSRWRLFSVGDTLPSKMKAGRTFGVNTGTISRILEYNSRTKKYKVEFDMPDGSKYIDTVPEMNLRSGNPQVMSPMERAFRMRNDPQLS